MWGGVSKTATCEKRLQTGLRLSAHPDDGLEIRFERCILQVKSSPPHLVAIGRASAGRAATRKTFQKLPYCEKRMV
jgi:hypothetical protein